MGPFVVTIVRLIVPVFILRWPLGGLIASVVADTLDVVLIAAIRSGMFEGLHECRQTAGHVYACVRRTRLVAMGQSDRQIRQHCAFRVQGGRGSHTPVNRRAMGSVRVPECVRLLLRIITW